MEMHASTVSGQRDRAPGRSLVGASIVLAVIASLFLLLAPLYATETASAGLRGGLPVTTGGRATLLEVEGWRMVWLLLLPILVSAVPLFARGASASLAVRSLAALLLFGFVLVGLFTVGAFYLPSALAMASALWSLVASVRRGRSA